MPEISAINEDVEDPDIQGWQVHDHSPSGASIANDVDAETNDRFIALRGNGYRLRRGNARP